MRFETYYLLFFFMSMIEGHQLPISFNLGFDIEWKEKFERIDTELYS